MGWFWWKMSWNNAFGAQFLMDLAKSVEFLRENGAILGGRAVGVFVENWMLKLWTLGGKWLAGWKCKEEVSKVGKKVEN